MKKLIAIILAATALVLASCNNDPVTYLITFDANGGTGTMESQAIAPRRHRLPHRQRVYPRRLRLFRLGDLA